MWIVCVVISTAFLVFIIYFKYSFKVENVISRSVQNAEL